jgi:hypothetical protein
VGSVWGCSGQALDACLVKNPHSAFRRGAVGGWEDFLWLRVFGASELSHERGHCVLGFSAVPASLARLLPWTSCFDCQQGPASAIAAHRASRCYFFSCFLRLLLFPSPLPIRAASLQRTTQTRKSPAIAGRAIARGR